MNQKRINIGIVGSRTWTDIDFIEDKILNYLEHERIQEVVIVSGGARGADSIGEHLAKKYKWDTIIHLPDWERYGRSAGFIRNEKIVKDSDVIFAFRKNNSSGTTHTINLARKASKKTYVYDA